MPRRALLVGGFAALVACRRSIPAAPEVVGPPPAEVALAGLPRDTPIPVVLETTEGEIRCSVDPVRAPRAVAMFVGLASGRAPFVDAATGRVAQRPYYDGQLVFRAIADMLIQSGCPLGDGTGTPGYRIPVETAADDRARLSRPGALLLARYHPAPNRVDLHPPPPGHVIGSQFVVTLGDMQHLAGEVTVLGSCADLDRVRQIAKAVASKERVVHLVRVKVPGT